MYTHIHTLTRPDKAPDPPHTHAYTRIHTETNAYTRIHIETNANTCIHTETNAAVHHWAKWEYVKALVGSQTVVTVNATPNGRGDAVLDVEG